MAQLSIAVPLKRTEKKAQKMLGFSPINFKSDLIVVEFHAAEAGLKLIILNRWLKHNGNEKICRKKLPFRIEFSAFSLKKQRGNIAVAPLLIIIRFRIDEKPRIEVNHHRCKIMEELSDFAIQLNFFVYSSKFKDNGSKEVGN